MPRGPILALFLVLSILAGLPAVNIHRTIAMHQNPPDTPWSPFGPRTDNLVITDYSDYSALLDAFMSGHVDLPDSPVPTTTCYTQDVFCTDPLASLDIFELDINHHAPFLGVSLEEPRTIGTPSVTVTGTGTGAGCSPGTGRVNLKLENLEERNSLLLDTLNMVRWEGPQSGGVRDDPSGGSSVDGIYAIPAPTGCVLAGTYDLSTTVYSGMAAITIGSGQVIAASFSVNYNSPSTLKLTQASVEIGRGLAHLLDKPNFVDQEFSFSSEAEYDDFQASSSQGLSVGVAPSKLPQSVLDEDCQAHPWFNPGNCYLASAYNLADSGGPNSQWWTSLGTILGVKGGYPGAADLRAACDHFTAAGFTITPAGATCQDISDASLSLTAPGSYPHLDNNGQSLLLYSRSTPARRHLGQVFFDNLNFLFGTPNDSLNGTVRYQYGCNPFRPAGVICDLSQAIFDTTNPDDWNLYTGGWGLRPSPEQFFFSYHSSFANGICGGTTFSFVNNYPFYCNPALDAVSYAGEFAGSLEDSSLFFSRAALLGHRTVMTVPVYTSRQTWSFLNGWNFQATNVPSQSSVVTGKAGGFGPATRATYWSLLNMRQVLGYTPSDPSFAPGGGDPNLIRRGWSAGTQNLNPFFSHTTHELEIIKLLYDSLLVPNPQAPGEQQAIDWMTTGHTSSFNPSEISCTDTGPIPLCSTGTTTQLWKLRGDLKWHDGTLVTAADVAYSVSAQSLSGNLLLPPPASILSVDILDSRNVRVRIPGQSSYYALGVGSIPIVPKHIWAPLCGDPFDPLSQCNDSSFDAMDAGLLVGSGPWVCRDVLSGHIGGSCVRDPYTLRGGQVIVAGGQIFLSANEEYFRGRPGLANSNLHKLSWADRNNDGKVTILDAADAALHFGQPDPYWNTGQNPLAPSVGVDPTIVDIGELATVAFYFDHGVISPFATAQLTALDPQIDPFFCPPAGC